ncbi:hypothetical protein Pla110_18170 [Polystyrenella longa]|uniref:Uncharacterized protein n=1 Tax=Polystyrenella longa TaxID=2528007 RepID=A0A518CLI4_9PLAN|nr:hypothetical protein [Polystyrenella longa]QDU80095.1 hypothetical protein Pla110_18170 [Polystyrenella longa]
MVGEIDDAINLETDDTTTTYSYTHTLQTGKQVKATYANTVLIAYRKDIQPTLKTSDSKRLYLWRVADFERDPFHDLNSAIRFDAKMTFRAQRYRGITTRGPTSIRG